MNNYFNVFDTKNNPFLNSDFSKFFGSTKDFGVNPEKLLEKQAKTLQVFNDANRHFVETLREVATKQGALIADLSKRGADLTREYPYNKEPKEQISYQIDLLREFQTQLTNVLEETRVVIDKGGKGVAKILSDHAEELLESITEDFKPKSANKTDKKSV